MKSQSANNNQHRSPRIPLSLQQVFLASNRGAIVDKPPPDRVAFKVFFRSFFSCKAESSNSNKRNATSASHNNRENKGKNDVNYTDGILVVTESAKAASRTSEKQAIPRSVKFQMSNEKEKVEKSQSKRRDREVRNGFQFGRCTASAMNATLWIGLFYSHYTTSFFNFLAHSTYEMHQ